MKTNTLIIMLAIALMMGGCATAYQTGQTPDDVYSSPAAPESEYVKAKKSDDRRYRQYDGEEDYTYEDYDDRYLRMKVRNRYQWNDLDDWYYYGNRYNFSYYNNWGYWNDPWYWNNPWSPVSYWNMYYNPYYYGGWGMGWGGRYGSFYGGWGGWYGSYWDPWYNPWYSGGYGYGYGWGWGSYWDPYLYGPGYFVGGTRSVYYGPRTTNLASYRGSGGTGVNRNVYRNGVSSNSSNLGGYRSTYGMRSEGSVNTNSNNSSASSRQRADAIRSGNYNSRSNNDTYNRSTYPSSSPTISGGSSGRSSGGSSGGSSGSGSSGSSAPVRRF
ncbi:MAG: hypothetical protein IPH58_11325 [Sphingobacteriales bacterium]|jgi:hypothetical protein|nr:hypothetical protein [Sphingobacteriales bacterium]